MSLYLSKDELEIIFKENYPNDEKPSDEILELAVDDFNGRLDNFADELVDDICIGIREGEFDNA